MLRRFDDAVADLERAAAAAPKDGPTLALLSAVQLNRGDRLAVQEAYARLTAAAGRDGAVSAMWPALLSVPPDPVQPQESIDRCTRGYVALLDGRFSEAEREGYNGMRYAPEFAWCAVMRAEARWRDGDVAAADRGLRWAIGKYPARLEPLQADAKGLLAELLSRDPAHAAEAIALARATLGARGERTAVVAALGRACAASGDAACARDAAGRVVADPRVPAALREEAERGRR
jgi:predicted Zn-dependent protease